MVQSQKSFSKARLALIFVCYAIAFAAPNYGQYQLSALGAEVMEKFDLNFVQFNSLFTAPMVPAVLFSVIGGMMVDRFGYKPVIGFTICLTVAGHWLRLIATNYATMFVAMFLLGFSAGFLTANASKVLALIFGEKKVGVIAGMVLSCSTCTLILSMSTTVYLGMNLAFIVSAVFSTLGLVLWLPFMPHLKAPKPELAAPAADTPEEKTSMVELFKAVMKNKYVWIAGVGMFCVNGAMASTGSMIPQALQSEGMTAAAAGIIGSLMMVGNFLGSTFTPTLTEKTGKFRLILMACGLISVFGSALAWRLPAGIPMYLGMIVTGYAYGSGMSTLMAIAVRLPNVGPKYAGTAGGLVATIQLLGGVCLPTYIASPIAGSSYPVYFYVIGASSLIWILAIYLLPKSLDRKAK